MNSTLGRTRVANWAFRTNRFEEGQEFKNVLHPSVTLEDGGDEFAFAVSTECADGGVFVRFPAFTSEARGVHHATIGEGNLRYILAVAVIPDADADVAADVIDLGAAADSGAAEGAAEAGLAAAGLVAVEAALEATPLLTLPAL